MLNAALLETDEIWSEKVSCSSNTKPRFRAERVLVSEELLILASCLLRPMSRNSVLEEFSVTTFAVIHEEIAVSVSAQPVPKAAYSRGRRDKYNRLR